MARRRPSMPVKDRAKETAEKIIAQIEAGTAPWQKPWKAGELSSGPKNAKTGREYRGFNRLWLAMNQPTNDPRWLTYNQAQEVGAQVRKGEKGTPIQIFITHKEEAVRDEKKRPVKDSDGHTLKRQIELDRPLVKWATVFHASQVDGLAPLVAVTAIADFERHELCEAILKNSEAAISHVAGNRAFYSPESDAITLPLKGQFTSPDAYYATALHELGHWSGHESRLNRDLAHPFGSEGYAKEELRAEIASLMTGQELGIGHDPGQHASYVKSWLKVLKDDPMEIFRASRDAQKIADFVTAFAPSQDLDQRDGAALFEPESVEEKAALAVLAERHGQPQTEANKEALKDYDDLPERVKDAVDELVEAVDKGLAAEVIEDLREGLRLASEEVETVSLG